MTTYGKWIGHYPDMLQEIEIVQKDSFLLAIKLTDAGSYVRSGDITWRICLSNMVAEGAMAEIDGSNHRFIPGKITVINNDKIKFTWLGDLNKSVTFVRDNI